MTSSQILAESPVFLVMFIPDVWCGHCSNCRNYIFLNIVLTGKYSLLMEYILPTMSQHLGMIDFLPIIRCFIVCSNAILWTSAYCCLGVGGVKNVGWIEEWVAHGVGGSLNFDVLLSLLSIDRCCYKTKPRLSG